MLFILLASASILFSQISRYKQEITQSLSDKIGLPLTIDSIESYWLGFHPTITLKDVQIFSPQHSSSITIKKIKVNILVLASIFKRQLVFDNLELFSSELLIKRSIDKLISINGIDFPRNENSSIDFQVFNQMNIRLHDIDLILEDENHGNLRLHHLNINHSLSQTHLQTDSLEFRSPLLAKTIQFNTFTTKITLERLNTNWLIHFNEIMLKNVWINISGKSKIFLEEIPTLDLDLNYSVKPTGNIFSWIAQNFFSKENRWIQSLIFSGNKIDGHIQLLVPIQQFSFEKPGSIFQLTTHFDNINLMNSYTIPFIEKLNGELFFEYPVIKTSVLTAKILGEPFNFQVDSNNKEDIHIAMDGSINTNTLKQIPNFENIEKFIDGTTKIKLTGNIITNPQEINYNLKIHSDLSGLKINLPEPLHKKSDEANSIELSIEKKSANINFLLNYANRISANLVLLKTFNKNWFIDSGNIYLGKEIAPFPKQKGVFINGKIQRLDLMDLIAYFPQERNTSIPIEDYFPIRFIHLDFDNLLVAKYPLNHTKFLTKYINHQWVIDIQSKNFAGNLKIPRDLTKTINIHLKHVKISSPILKSLKKNGDIPIKIKPQQIPSLNINCKSFYFDEHNLGTIILKTNTRNNTFFIEKFAIISPNINLKMNGAWHSNGLDKTNLQGHAIAKNFGEFLKEWQISESLVGANGHLDFKLYWKNAIYNMDLAQLNGYFTFSLKDGVILDVVDNKYELLGSILNVFSIDSLEFTLAKPFGLIAPKRKGFDFEVEKVNFIIDHGVLKTNDFYLHGKLAEIEAYGKIDLVNKTYDLQLEMTPFLTAYLPMNLALAGGPAMLGIVWASDKLMGGILNRFFRQYYYVTGPWTKPHYQKLQKAPEKNVGDLQTYQLNHQGNSKNYKKSIYKGYHD